MIRFGGAGKLCGRSAAARIFCFAFAFTALTATSQAQAIIATFAGGDRTFTFDSTPATAIPIARVNFITLDLQGNLVVPIPEMNVVVRVNSDGTITRLAGSGTPGFSGDNGPATAANLRAPRGAAYDAAGNLYIADSLNNRVRKVSAGVITTLLAPDPKATVASPSQPTSIAIDRIHNVIYVNDTGNGQILRIAGSSVTRYAGTGSLAASCLPAQEGQTASQAQLCQAEGIAVDSSGNLFIADFKANRIRRVDFNTQQMTTVAGNGVAGYSPDGAPAKSALHEPADVALDASNTLYISEAQNTIVRRISLGTLSTVAGTTSFGYSGDGGPAIAAQLNSPFGLAIDAANHLYIADRDNFRVRKIDSQGVISTVAGNGTSSVSNIIAAAEVPLSQPWGVTVGPDGKLYVADAGNDLVRQIQPGGSLTVAGTGAAQESGDGGPASLAGVTVPSNTAFDSAGSLYIADTGTNTVRKVDRAGNISTFAGAAYIGSVSSVAGSGGDGGPAAKAQLNSPIALAVDSHDNVFIADAFNNRVRKVSNGIITPVAAGTLAEPLGLAFDANGNLYIADSLNGRIKKVDPNGAVTTYAGGGKIADLAADGQQATSAEFDVIGGIATDRSGTVYFTDIGTSLIWAIAPGGVVSRVAGNGIAGLSGDGGDPKLASLSGPTSLAIDAQSGALYVADRENDLIRVIYPRAPAFLASPPSLTLTAASQGKAADAQTVNLSSATSLAFSVKISPASPWLSVSPDSGVFPATLQVTTDPGSLPPGPYAADIIVTSPQASPPTQTIHVTFNVTGAVPSLISLDRTQLSFSFAKQAASASQTIHILNGGSGTLGYRATATTSTTIPWLSLSGSSGSAGVSTPSILLITANPAGLDAGSYTGTILLTNTNGGDQQTIVVGMTITLQTMSLSQKGLTFSAVQGGGISPPQSFEVLDLGAVPLDWTVTTRVPGGGKDFLTFSSTAGQSASGVTSPSISVAASSSSLAPGTYYEQVIVSSPTAINSPQLMTVVLNVLNGTQLAGPVVQPSGLFFTSVAGGSAPSPQTFTITNLSTSPLIFNSKPVPLPDGNWLAYDQLHGTVAAGGSLTVSVTPQVSGLPAGVYQGFIGFQFSDGSTATENIRLVIAPQGTLPGSFVSHASPSCTPKAWIPLFTTLPDNFVASIGWPTSIVVKVFDDCANPMTSGAVSVGFTNGDHGLTLKALGDGRWSGTWPAVNVAIAQTTLTAIATSTAPALTGTLTISGGVVSNPDPPIVPANGVISAGYSDPGSPLPQGGFVSIYGAQLSNSDSQPALSLPLELQLQDVQVAVGTKLLPLSYTSKGLINGIFPYGLAQDAEQDLVVQRGTKLSAVVTVQVSAVQPAIFLYTGTQGVITDYNNGYALATPDSPAKQGDVLVIYCTGLGAVDSNVQAGAASPGDPVANVTNLVTISIGGQPAQVNFKGLTPGLAGLYQLNVVVPANVQPGPAVPVIITSSGLSSKPVTIAVQ